MLSLKQKPRSLATFARGFASASETSNNDRLKGKVLVITGAGTGLDVHIINSCFTLPLKQMCTTILVGVGKSAAIECAKEVCEFVFPKNLFIHPIF